MIEASRLLEDAVSISSFYFYGKNRFRARRSLAIFKINAAWLLLPSLLWRGVQRCASLLFYRVYDEILTVNNTAVKFSQSNLVLHLLKNSTERLTLVSLLENDNFSAYLRIYYKPHFPFENSALLYLFPGFSCLSLKWTESLDEKRLIHFLCFFEMAAFSIFCNFLTV